MVKAPTPTLNTDAVAMNMQLTLMEQADQIAQQTTLIQQLLELIANGLVISNFPELPEPVAPVTLVPEAPFDAKAFAQTLGPLLAQFDNSEKLDTLNNNLIDLVKEVTKTRGVGSQSITSVNTRPIELLLKDYNDYHFDFTTVATSGASYQYVGTAIRGSATSTRAWTIERLVYSNGTLASLDLTDEGAAIWDNRASEVYS